MGGVGGQVMSTHASAAVDDRGPFREVLVHTSEMLVWCQVAGTGSSEGSKQRNRKSRQVGSQQGCLERKPRHCFLAALALTLALRSGDSGWSWGYSSASNPSRSVISKPLAHKLGLPSRTAFLLATLPLTQPTPPSSEPVILPSSTHHCCCQHPRAFYPTVLAGQLQSAPD